MIDRLAVRDFDIGRQSLELARAGVVFPQHRARRDHLLEGADDLGLEALHAGGADLADDHVAVPVEHQSGQPVGLAVNQAIERRGIQSLAERERDLQAVDEQWSARRIASIAAEDARADQRVRIDVSVAEEPLAIADHAAQRAGREARERRAVRVDLVAEHPQMARAEAPVFPRFQAQFGQGGPVAERLGGMSHRGSLVPI